MKLLSDNEYEAILWEKYTESRAPEEEIRERFLHSVSVGKKAVELIERFCLPVDKAKARVAGILHDYAKFESPERFRQIAEEFHQEALLQESPKILHALLGPFFLQKELGITDPEIAGAVRNHTTGAYPMSLLEEVIFLADFIEDTRAGDYFEEAKTAAQTDFRKAIAIKIARRLENHPDDEQSRKMYEYYAEVPWKI